MALTKQEVENLIIIERSTASLSVISTLTLLTTFILIKDFRTLSNTLIFYASFANIFANVAALIGGSALTHEHGALCQFQGFLLEMFMQSDPMWSLAMAVNVYLVFFRRYDAHSLKKLYWIYALLCYGLPFIPAIVCLLIRKKNKGYIYGNATLWCWIDNEWAPLRIYSYYAPIWVAILGALMIYVRVGVEIFQKRTQLRAAAHASETYNSVIPPSQSEQPSPFTGVRTTEIQVTHDPWLGDIATPTAPTSAYSKKNPKDNNYSVTISAPKVPSATFQRRPSSADKIKWAYTKVALLFAVSILITWVPASVNRVYGLRYPKNPSYALNIGSAIVLPLQGFWNTVIYFATSLSICRGVWARFRGRKEVAGFRRLGVIQLGGRRGKESVGDSTVELSTSRSISRDDSDPF